MPIIPLGINTQEFDYSDADRSRSRSELGIAEDAVVILFSGRLSFHAKAHPLAMYQAIEKAAQGGPVVLIECGWFANEHIEKAFLDAFNLFCSNIKRVVLDGRDENSRRLAWSSADIFCSLSDNFQETFGLTPLEGMAAGLPVVVSDWNGYRDTVRDGIDGFRIPTYQPPSGLGEDLAFRHACNVDNYDMYCGHTSQLVAVDIELVTQALAALIHDRSLREQMGNAARTRARQDFDWATIIPRYEELWSELNAMRQFHKNKQGDCGVQDRPGRLDPFILFQSYPTRTLQASDQLQLAPSYPNAQLAYERLIELRQLQMIQFAEFVQLTNNDCQAIFQFLEGGAKTVEQIVCLGAPTARVHIHRSLLWLMKIGLIRAL
jgi:hypothetical protein